ncbi:MAG: four-helix bundle copper-binding protein [Chitinophagales bacterium]|nr:four-helix bundle copper-binding protein [Chitinophagales bacterium]
MANLTRCIRLDQDCSAACMLTAQMIMRSSEYAPVLCSICAEICDDCASECSNHIDMEHCKRCSEACQRCAEECRKITSY